ncbi:hypothetical protein Poly41_42820 [Novipirellula artificiosorum]|uniref:Uncharacterized protein n=1 Tax=Novipirellula artificiosorum TaxID=2528016 RepID=A0A5C6DEN6_9BACT|nr:hypothetical protein Poly41_42820 [Novipirellula artificiosorum]
MRGQFMVLRGGGPSTSKRQGLRQGRLVRVQFKDLALNFDRSQEDPKLVRRKLNGTAIAHLIELIGDSGMLIGRRLEPEAGIFPCRKQGIIIGELSLIFGLDQNQQAKASDFDGLQFGAECSESSCEFVTSHLDRVPGNQSGRTSIV